MQPRLEGFGEGGGAGEALAQGRDAQECQSRQHAQGVIQVTAAPVWAKSTVTPWLRAVTSRYSRNSARRQQRSAACRWASSVKGEWTWVWV